MLGCYRIPFTAFRITSYSYSVCLQRDKRNNKKWEQKPSSFCAKLLLFPVFISFFLFFWTNKLENNWKSNNIHSHCPQLNWRKKKTILVWENFFFPFWFQSMVVSLNFEKLQIFWILNSIFCHGSVIVESVPKVKSEVEVDVDVILDWLWKRGIYFDLLKTFCRFVFRFQNFKQVNIQIWF